MDLAPIVLFVYNRPEITRQTLNALALNDLADQSTLYIYADGPKTGTTDEMAERIRQTSAVLKERQWCKEVYIITSSVNKGLSNSVITGVTETIDKHGKAIVLEDDIITSKYFLKFMNEALETYESNERVLSIGAFNFFANDDSVPETFFIPIPDCWGWATWKNRWKLFEPNAQSLLNKLRANNLINQFNLHGDYNFEQMLIDQVTGGIDSWAIRWQAIAYLNNTVTLYPKHSVTKNIGLNTSGTHSSDDRFSKYSKFTKKPIKVVETDTLLNPAIIRKMNLGYARTASLTKIQKIKSSVKRLINQLLPDAIKIIYREISSPKKKLWWTGNYPSWQQAQADSIGYDEKNILKKTLAAILKVKNGEAAFERDSVLFYKPEYNWPVLTPLLTAAVKNDKNLSVLDFGGALGSTYFQNRLFLKDLKSLEWSIIEQPHYTIIGNEEIAENGLKFYSDISACLVERKPTVLLLSSVLQYIEQPYQLISDLIDYDFDYIIIDKTAFVISNSERLTVQTVPPDIYKASYPAWFFIETKFTDAFKHKYALIADFDPYPGLQMILEDKTIALYKGFIFKLNKSVDDNR